MKVATPATAVFELPPVQLSVPGPERTLKVTTVLLSVRTVMPDASWIVTCGWIASGTPA